MIPAVRPSLSRGRDIAPAPDEPATMAAAFLAAAERHPGNGLRVVGKSEARRTYPELLDAARRALSGLREAGLGPGDPLICVVPPAADFFPVFWGCLLGGILPVVVARPMLWQDGDPGFDKLDHTSRSLGGPPVLGAEGTPLRELRPDWTLLDTAVLLDALPAADLHVPAPSDTAMYQLSSGSTSSAKVIPLTHRGLVELAVGVREELSADAASTMLNWMPLDHSGGFLLYPVAGVWLGADLIHVDTELVLGTPTRWFDLLDRHAVTHAWAPNFAYRLLTEAIAPLDDPQWRLDRLRCLVSGGEQVGLGVMREFFAATARFGLREEIFTPVWGMAETTTAISHAPLRPHRIHHIRRSSLAGAVERVDAEGPDTTTFLSVGPPAPGASFRVVDADGAILPEDRVGRLQVASARITPGYLGDPAASAAVFTADGWFDTGDLAFMTDGEITIAGRVKDLLILNGNNHYCHDIELAATVDGVLPGHIAACGIPNADTGTEDLVVFFTPEAGADAAEVGRRLGAAVAERLRLSVSRAVPVAEAEFPRTSAGKVQRAKLRERFVDGGFEVPASQSVPTPPAPGAIRAVIAEFTGESVDTRRPFHELGLGSVQLMRIRVRLTEVLGRDVPITALYAHPTVEALASHLEGAGSREDEAPAPLESPDRRIAVIGMAARFPGAPDVDTFWANLLGGVDSVVAYDDTALTAAGAPTGPGRVGATGALDDVDAFDHRFFGMSAKEAALTDPQQRLFAECAHHALEDAGYAGGGARVGLFAGSGMNLYPHHTYLRNNLAATVDAGDPLDSIAVAVGNQPDFLATRVAYRLGLTGPAVNVQTACSTSLVAVHLAAQALLSGDAEVAIAGASAVHVPQVTAYHHTEGSILSGEGRCRPFDADADGTVGGSGVAAVVLKPYAKALADGDTIHGVILGTAVNNDGDRKVGFTAPAESGQVDVLRSALRRAGIDAESVGYVEAHGTGTPVGDPIEVGALARVYRPGTVLGSVKANVGHLDSCAGMAGLIKALLVVRHGEIPPQINFRRPNPALGPDAAGFQIAKARRSWTGTHPRRAAVTALGVGGTNAHVIVEEPGPAAVPSPETGPVVLPLSAADTESLTDLASAFRDRLRAEPGIADLAATAALGRRHLRHRLAVTGSDASTLADGLDRFLAGRGGPRLSTGDGAPGGLAFLFTGQGSDPGPVDELLARFPAFGEVFDRAAAAALSEGADIRAALADPDTVWTTALAQPAITAVQCALTALWTAAGQRPERVAGHSVGEFAALAAAGALTVEDAVRLAAGRGRLMQRLGLEGRMLAVLAERSVVDELVAATGLEVAVVNGSAQFTLGGPPEAAEAAEAWCAERDVTCRRLPVTRAFHTSLVEPMLGELAGLAAGIEPRPTTVPFVSGVDGRERAPGWTLDVAYLRAQAREAVRFDAVLDTLTAAGSSFLELGFDGVLSSIGRRREPSAHWIASQRRGVGPVDAVMRAAGALYATGADLDWATLQRGRRVPLPRYPFRPHRHWIEAAPRPTATTVEQSTVDGPVLERVLAITAELLGADTADVAPGDAFIELGADSLSLLNLTRRITEEYDVRIPVRELFGELATPAAVAEAVTARGGAPVSAPPAVVPVAAEPVPVPVAAEPVREGVKAIIDRQLAIMEAQLRLLGGEAPQAAPVEAPPVEPVAVTAAAEPEVEPEPAEEGETLLDFSLYFFGDYPEGRADAYRHILDAASYADEHGFHAVWMPERHFHSFGGIFPNPSVLASAIAARTDRIRLNAGSVVLPLHHPVRVAEEWSMVDNLSGGRVGLGVAPGWSAQDFVFAPENYGRHKQVMYEHLATVRDLWAGRPLKMPAGGGGNVEVRLFPRPVQEAPPMFTAIVGNPDSYRQAAANDLGVITNLMTQDVATLAANIALYRATRAEHGLDPDAGRVVVLLHTHLGPDDAAAKETAFEPFCAYLKSSLSLLGQVANSLGMAIDFENTPEDDLRFMLERAYERYCAERALIGSPEQVASIARAVKEAGADEIAAFIDFGMTAREVADGLPHLNALRRSFLTDAPAVIEAPMSPGQRRLWTADRVSGGGPGYNEAAAVRLDGPLDRKALRRALQAFVDRHATLRTVYGEADGRPSQFVRPHVDAGLVVTEHVDADVEAVAAEAMAAESRREFDLATGPVFAFRLLAFGPDLHVLVCSFHHIAADGWSYGIFGEELGKLYRAEINGRPAELPPIGATYAEISRERDARPVDEEGAAFWRRTFAEPPSPLDLPGGRPRPLRPSDVGRSLFLELPAELTARVLQHARRERVTPFTILLSGLAAAIRRLTGREDFVLGSGVGGRDDRTERLFGFLVETVPLRFDLRGTTSFRSLSSRVAGIAAAAIDHAEVPFDEIVRAVNPPRVPGRGALFDIAVEYSNTADFTFDLPGVTAARLPLGLDKSPSDLTLYMSCDDTVRWHAEYRTDVYGEDVVGGLFTAFRESLEAAVTAPDAPLPVSGRRLTPALQGPPSRTSGETLHGLVDRAVREHGERVAVAYGDERWTYRELDEQAGAIAAALHAAGVAAGDVVAVCLPRRPRLVAAQLAVMRLGAVLLPLDPLAPAARLSALVAACEARAVVGPDLGAAVTIDLDAPPVSGPVPRVEVDEESAAYCIFTSGSTGRPKGVLVPHRAAVNTVSWRAKATELGPEDVVGHHLGLGFDANLAEIYPTLAAGATLLMAPEELRNDPRGLAGWWREEGVTVATLPTALMEELFTGGLPAGHRLRCLVTGGSRLRLRPPASFPTLFNEYGPTENAIVTTAGVVSPHAEGPPDIGRPIDGNRLYVLGSDGRPVPPGTEGELWVAGPGVALGYLGDEEATAAAFVADPEGTGLMYRTGDLGSVGADGTVEFRGRTDEQVSIRGNRVEPGESEAALAAVPGVRRAAVIAVEERGETRLAAYVVADAGLTAEDLAGRLASALPSYQVPELWTLLPELPLGPNGKLDRERLPAPARTIAATGAAPEGELERAVHDAWCAELDVTAVPVDVSFFNLGGHSLAAIRLANRLRDELGLDVPVTQIFSTPTVRGLAAALGGGSEIEEEAPLTYQQEQMWAAMALRDNPASTQIALRVDIDGPLDTAALSAAIDGLLARHGALRTRILDRDGVGRQEVVRHRPFTLPVDEVAEEDLAAWCVRWGREPYDLLTPPLLRARLAVNGGDRRALLLAFQHLVVDGWSVLNLVAEIGERYRALTESREPVLPELVTSYAAYARNQRAAGNADEALLDYWRDALAGAPAKLVHPTDRPRSALTGTSGDEYTFALPVEVVDRLGKLAAARGTTVHPILSAGFALLTAALTGEHDIVLAGPYAQRERREQEPLVGFFASLMPTRVDVSADISFEDFVSVVRERFLEGLAHQPVPFPRILGALDPQWVFGAPAPIATALLTVNPPVPKLPLPGLRTEVIDLALETARRDFVFLVAPESDAIGGAVEFSTDLYDRATIVSWCDAYAGVLGRAAADPATPLPVLLAGLREELGRND